MYDNGFDFDCAFDELPEEEKEYIREMMYPNMTDDEAGEAWDGFDFGW